MAKYDKGLIVMIRLSLTGLIQHFMLQLGAYSKVGLFKPYVERDYMNRRKYVIGDSSFLKQSVYN